MTDPVRMRVQWCLGIIIFAFLVFSLRLFQVQGIDNQAFAAMAREIGTVTTEVPAPRGEIYDRNGIELANSVDGTTITADPSMTAINAPQIARILFEKLGDRVDYFDTIEKLRRPDTRFVYLERNLQASDAKRAVDAIREAGYPGVFTETVALRSYPGGELAANLLGFIDHEGKGVVGLERMYNDQLSGTDGFETYEISPRGQRIPMADTTEVEMVPGRDIRTTIDRELQWYADARVAEVAKSSGANFAMAVTMDVKTCEIVQMSQAPTYNADTRSNITKEFTVNRAIEHVYEPGSVMKVFTMAALADQGKVAADSKFVVPGNIRVDGFTISDWWGHGQLNMTAAGVIAQSSNLGTVIAARHMTPEVFYDYLRKFGFGGKTGMGFPGESVGIVRPPEQWMASTLATTAFGQGVSVTGMQMVRALGAIANDGIMCTPQVVQATIDEDGEETSVANPAPERVMSSQAAAEVTRMMEAVVSEEGTARRAQIEGYRVAGKTGTAWRVDTNTGRYVSGQYVLSFAGFAPADDPRFVTYVMIDKPRGGGGGSTAGPVFQDIMSMALERFGVPPTGAEKPKIEQYWD